MTARSNFKQNVATRGLMAAVKAGFQPTGYCIAPDGSIRIELVTGSVGVDPKGDLDDRLDAFGSM